MNLIADQKWQDGRISELEGKSRENFQTKEQRGKKIGDRSAEACVTVSNIST